MDESQLPTALFSRLTTVAILAAQRAADVIKRGYGQSFSYTSKESKYDLVTEIDVASENEIKTCIREFFPDHTFLCEEGGLEGDNPTTIRWIIDPLDGTVNFVHSIPMFSVSIAATFNGEVLSGVILHPLLGELFVAEKGKGAFLNGKRLHVSQSDILETSFIATGFPYNVHENPHHCIELFSSFAKMGTPIRRIGSAAIDLAYVAASRFDAFWEVTLNPWDIAAGTLLIEEAGGKVSRFDGKPIDILKEGTLIATNGKLHEQVAKSIHIVETEEE